MQHINLSDEEFERLRQMRDEIRKAAEGVSAAASATMLRVKPILDDLAVMLRELQYPPMHGYDVGKEDRDKHERRRLANSTKTLPYYRQYEKQSGKKKRR
ncbi:hypothetical protein [uncultured Thiothrix sp.]|uniref:hypothetical protein n=1 Tax=uncultured Thiothrix sp. TaxID=223185 RepID=UPI0026361BAD|nr:hypothetical protein [uncultured Thiothrix sp.]